MTNKPTDKAEGRAKEAAGAPSGDRGLKNGSAKKTVEKVAETLIRRNKRA
jgi:uncharacterized protein YjbJ (UPF0337 family)